MSIVDLSGGAQPMWRERTGLAAGIAYNGEVYNFLQLREFLQQRGFAFQTRSDTEVVLAAHLVWGSAAIDSLDGMFAYALWDENLQRLLLVRDRLGIKPLFYVPLQNGVAFASEPKALFLVPGVERHVNRSAVLEYFLHGAAFAAGYVTHDRSFFDGIFALPAAHKLEWSNRSCDRTMYWCPLDEMTDSFPKSAEQCRDEIRSAVVESIRGMLMGEVARGTAISGGLDSSIITAEAAEATAGEISSACISYRPDHCDPDARHAALLSDHLHERGIPHELLFTDISENDYLAHIDELVCAFDEPHWEIRQIGMFENYRTLAEAGRTVVLTGEGADELFFGYYANFPGFRHVLSDPTEFARNWKARLSPVVELLAPAFGSETSCKKVAEDLIEESITSYLLPYWQRTSSQLRAVQCWYIHTFLSWLLTDNDRCSMAHSVEGRFPYLSRHLVSLALKMPPEWNVSLNGNPKEKVLLRSAFRRALPPEIWRDRAKSPLPVPLNTAYHKRVADRLDEEVECAPASFWDLLNKDAVTRTLAEFRELLCEVSRSAGADAGHLLTAYIPLHEKSQVRTAHLFAILTLIRWYNLLIEGNA